MGDNKTKTGGEDRKRVAEDQGYEVSYFARKHGLSTEEARKIIKRVGNDREKLNAEVEKVAAGTRNQGQAESGRGTVVGKRRTNVAKAAALGGAVAAGALAWSRRDQIGARISKLTKGIGSRGRRVEADHEMAAQGTTGESSRCLGTPERALMTGANLRLPRKH
jgi:hypothetical protein